MIIFIDDQNEPPYNTKVVIESHAEDVYQVADLLKQALLGLGFMEESVNSVILTGDSEDDNQN